MSESYCLYHAPPHDDELVQFSWSYMQPNLSPASTLLYNDYYNYLEDISTITNADLAINNSISIYPNPTTGYISINTNDRLKRIKIFSINGAYLFSSESKDISLNSLKSGVYLLKIELDDGIINRRIIKK